MCTDRNISKRLTETRENKRNVCGMWNKSFTGISVVCRTCKIDHTLKLCIKSIIHINCTHWQIFFRDGTCLSQSWMPRRGLTHETPHDMTCALLLFWFAQQSYSCSYIHSLLNVRRGHRQILDRSVWKSKPNLGTPTDHQRLTLWSRPSSWIRLGPYWKK